MSLVHGGPASCKNVQLHEGGNLGSIFMHSFIQHAFGEVCFESGARLGNIHRGRPGPALKEMQSERRRTATSTWMHTERPGRLFGKSGRSAGRSERTTMTETESSRHRRLRESWSATGHDVLCHFKC